MEGSGQVHALATLPLKGNSPRYSLGGSQSWTKWQREENHFTTPAGFHL